MYKKHCFNCHRPSYSSCDTGEWICPICETNLSKQKSFASESQVFPFKKLIQKENHYPRQTKTSKSHPVCKRVSKHGMDWSR